MRGPPLKLEPRPSDLDWNIPAIVSELRTLRDASLAARQRVGRPAKLPSRRKLLAVVDGLSAALFPHRLAPRELADKSVDFFVGHTLDMALRELVDQVIREFQFVSGQDSANDEDRKRSIALVREFAAQLPTVRTLLESDIRAAFEVDPGARSLDEVLACSPGLSAITLYRMAHALYVLGARLVARIITEIGHSTTGIDIHPGAKIAGSFFIDHGTGVVIGETAVVGQRVRLYHAVTLGAKRHSFDSSGLPSKGSPRHPVVEDDVVIYAGATILGRITIGRGSVIGGNVWLTESVPAGSVISQAKVRNDDFEGGSGI